MKDAVRALAAGKTEDKKLKKFAKDVSKKFVFLNVYCRSVKEEHDPRGPDGPYQFVDKSVPVVVIKRWDGKTFKQQLGWNQSWGVDGLAKMLQKAAKDNGPIAPPKALRPLLKAMAAADKHLGAERTAPAIRELNRIVKLGTNKKKFPDGPPEIVGDAQKRLDGLADAARKALESARANETDPASLEKTYRKLLATYRGLGPVEQTIRDALRDLKKRK